MRLLVGIDEAGRGPLAGPVVSAAVILAQSQPIEGLDDSKKLSVHKRIQFEVLIKKNAYCWSVAWATVAEIDQFNILAATLLSMQRAVNKLKVTPDYALIDGNHIPPELNCPAQAIVRGDNLHACISAASILAKQTRDRIMCRLDRYFPQYGFSQHKGYPTQGHIAALKQHGACRHHRTSFAPVRRCLS